MLGERIRKLRKQKKMTLEALAGEELTKGMLSLIENNKANPSMDSLAYIAQQLDVEMSELLEDVSSQELRDILEEAEKLYNSETDMKKTNTKQIIKLIDPYLANLTGGYESARLLDIYFRCLYEEKNENWRVFANKAASLYEQLNITSKRAKIGIFRTHEKFIEHDYEQSLQIFLSERAKIEANEAYIDPMTQLDLDYHEAIFHFAVGDTNSATRVMENAIDFSKKHRIFYLIDDLYRIAAAHAMMEKDQVKNEYYLKKLKQYGEFADDTHSFLFYHLMKIENLIADEQDYKKALETIEQFLADSKVTDSYKPHFYLEKGKALYGLKLFEEALEWLEKINIPTSLHHPFDLSLFYVMDSYKALCYDELNNWNKAYEFAKKAVENLAPFPQTHIKDFVTKTFERIKANRNETKQVEE